MSFSIDLEPPLLIAKGEIDKHEHVQKFGANIAVGTSMSPVSDGGIYKTPQAAGAIAVRIKAGGDANDTAAGSGAREVTVYGLDENFARASEAIATNGASVSLATSTTWTRIHRVKVTASGTYANSAAGSHVGEIVIEDTSANEWASISAAIFPFATTQIAAYSVAAGDVAYMVHNDVFTDSSKTTNILLFIRENIDETSAPYSPMRVINPFALQGGNESHDLANAPIKVTGPADVGFMAKVDSGTATVSAGFELLIIRG